MSDGYENYLEAEMVHGTCLLIAEQMEGDWPSVIMTSVSGLCRGVGLAIDRAAGARWQRREKISIPDILTLM